MNRQKQSELIYNGQYFYPAAEYSRQNIGRFFQNYQIINLSGVNIKKYKKHFNQEILNNYKRAGIKCLTNLKELNISNCDNITNLNHLIRLEKLVMRGECGIDDNGIRNLSQLEEFDANHNDKISNISHMTKLKKS